MTGYCRVCFQLVSADGSTIDGSQCGDPVGAMSELARPPGDATETESTVSGARGATQHAERHGGRRRHCGGGGWETQTHEDISY